MRHVFLMDPIEHVRVDQDSTFALMMEAQRRGHEVLYGTIDGLDQRGGRARAMLSSATLRPVQGDHVSLGPVQRYDLGELDVIWMRKDPPFDMGYIFCTYLLDLASRDALVVNHPDGLRAMNEKAWAMAFPDLVPDSLITQSQTDLRDFSEELGAIIVKPLDGNGGEGVFIVKADDPNRGVILEMSTLHGARKVMAQRYLPEAKLGDKRIILVDGVAVGACLRVPSGVDHRGNIHVGARVAPCKLTERDREICEAIGPALSEAGQIFVGIDVIGDYLTEVNVTSPTCIHEINGFDGICIESLTLDAVEERMKA